MLVVSTQFLRPASLRFEMLQALLLSDRLRIFNLLNNALGVSLLAVGWVCSEAGVAKAWLERDTP